MKKSDSFFLPSSQLYFDRSRKRHNSNFAGYEVILNKENEIKIKDVGIFHTPQKNGKENLDFKNRWNKTKEISLKEGESLKLGNVFPLIDNSRLTIKNKGNGKFEIFFRNYLDKDISFSSHKLILNGGVFANGNEVVPGTKKTVDAFSVNTNIYTKIDGELVLSKQEISFNETLSFGDDYNFFVPKEKREEYLNGWLDRNKYVNIMGHKFKVDYLIKKEDLTSERLMDVFKGIFSLTNVETGEKIYVSKNEETINPLSNESKEYSNEVSINGKSYVVSVETIDDRDEFSIAGFSIELKN
jgi:hypothetical protein